MAVHFYRYSFDTAKRDGDVDLYRESQKENLRMCEYITDEKTGFYAKAYKNNCVDSDGSYTKNLIKEFGMERTMFVFASTIKMHLDDRRIPQDVREWAENFNRGLKRHSEIREVYIGTIHPGVMGILAKNVMDEHAALNLFNVTHCEEDFGDLEGKILVLSPQTLKEEYWSPENQLWRATGGFGCQKDAGGRAVYATCLFDGEETRWNRGDFIGVIKDEYLPDWAREKLDEIQTEKMETQMLKGDGMNLS